jgi:hypothetical protein
MMNTPSQHDLHGQYENEIIAVTPFVTNRMGILPGQTSIKIDSYNILCAPYRISMKNAIVMAAFSRDELVFFQRYTNGMAGMTIVFQQATSQRPLKIFARCVLKSIAPMKGRETIGLVSVDFKPCPPDLITILGDFLMVLERLKVEYDDYKDKRIAINPETAKLLGYNNFAELTVTGGKCRIAIFGLASNRLEFLVPIQSPDLTSGTHANIKLFFQSYQFTVHARITESHKLPSNAQKVTADLDFCSELVDIIEKYRFSERFAAKTK